MFLAILVNNNLECKVLQKTKDIKKNITLVNIYGPDTDEPSSFVKLMKLIELMNSFKNILVIYQVIHCDNYIKINILIARNKLSEIIHETI